MWDGPYGNWGSRKYLLASLDQSLKRMGLDYVDIFYHHRMDPETPLEETMGALATAVCQGKALYVGLSNYDGETLEQAAAILKGHTVHPDVRVMVIPATQKIYKECIKEGLLDIFVDAGCAVNTPSCGPCMGGHMGVMAAGEKCVSTTNRNFVGRMGHVDSLIYLASPEVAAASAIAGCIANPEKGGEK